jgi:hypothetical protein
LRKYDISKSKDRTELSRLTDEFLAKGGKINKCLSGDDRGQNEFDPQDALNPRIRGLLRGDYAEYLDADSQCLSDDSRRYVDLGDGCRQYLPEFYDEEDE